MSRLGRCALLIPLLWAASAGADERADWDAQFRKLRTDVRGGKWYSDRTNEEGYLAWSESYVLMALVAHYRATGDEASLEMLVEHGARIWRNRDDRRGVQDAFRGRAVAGWSSTKYTNGKPYVWAVHSGMILHPLAEFCLLVEEREALRRFRPTVAKWKPWIVESVSVFDPQWREGPRDGEGHYVGLALGGRTLPHNQMNALGRAQLSVSRLRDTPRWAAERAGKLLRFFKNRLVHDKATDSYDWAYQAVRGRGEDISHAAINVDFAARGARAGLVFDATDMRRFANTLLKVVRKGDDAYATTVSGTGRVNRYAPEIPRWLALAQWNREVYTAVERWCRRRMRDGKLPPNRAFLTAAAMLCEHDRR